MSIKQTIIFLLIVVIFQLLYYQLNASPLTENNNAENMNAQHITRFKRQDMMYNGEDVEYTTGVSIDEEPGILEKLANYAMALLKKFVQWMNSEN